MKKWIVLLGVVFMAVVFAACGGKTESASQHKSGEDSNGRKETAVGTQKPDEEAEKSISINTSGLMLYQYDKDNMDVEFEDEDESYMVKELEKLGQVQRIMEKGLTFYAVDEDGFVSYYISKEDYKNRLTEVDVTLDNFDQYFELVEEEIWDDEGVTFHKYYRLKDEYLFAMVDFDHLYANTADATCRPIEYEATIDVENRTYDWGGYDTRYEEIETWIDFEDTDDSTYRNVIVSTYPENYITDNGDGTATGVAHEAIKLINVSIKFYYLSTK